MDLVKEWKESLSREFTFVIKWGLKTSDVVVHGISDGNCDGAASGVPEGCVVIPSVSRVCCKLELFPN